jgi:hypothetical protein
MPLAVPGYELVGEVTGIVADDLRPRTGSRQMVAMFGINQLAGPRYLVIFIVHYLGYLF